MGNLDFESFLAAYWWVGLIVLALILSVRGTIPIWLGIGFSAIMMVFFSNNNISYGVRSVLSSAGHAVMNVFR